MPLPAMVRSRKAGRFHADHDSICNDPRTERVAGEIRGILAKSSCARSKDPRVRRRHHHLHAVHMSGDLRQAKAFHGSRHWTTKPGRVRQA